MNLVLLINIMKYNLYNLGLRYARHVLFIYLNELHAIIVTYYEIIILYFV